MTVLHCDMNNFFASVEIRDDPSLKDKPVVVTGDPQMRHGIVLARNDIAKKFDIVSGESSASARKKCPNLIIIKASYQKYLDVSRRTRRIFLRYTDKIYPYGIDEAWLDLDFNDYEKAAKIADEIRTEIKNEIGITASVGVSFNHVFSKLASDLKKPDATTVITEADIKSVVWSLPAFDLLFVGSATRRELQKIGVLTIGDLAKSDPEYLVRRLGKKGRILWEFANGNDSLFDPCADSEEDIKSLGNTVTPPKDIESAEEAGAYLYMLSLAVSQRLKKHEFKTGRVGICYRLSDFSSFTRQKLLEIYTDDAADLFVCASELYNKNCKGNLRSIGIRVDKLIKAGTEQLTLETHVNKIPKNAVEMLEKIKSKYGDIKLEYNGGKK